MSNPKKRKNSFKDVAKKVKEISVQLKKMKIPFSVLNGDSPEKLERKKSISRWRLKGVPQGCLAVYVGQERQRFVIPTTYLSHPVFMMLLEKAREEYGFKQKEGLTVPCDVEAFENAMFIIQSSQSASGQFNLETLVNNLPLKTPPLTPHE
ncbi:hypothetical protein SUGI_1168860 [Cryptomeria japonica]|uniref:auxin-responsive protein SAUR32 n=1 Tax=Cryptomeria japonica TaxID=3369 RepID=UPI002414A61E|nr:auxin-responsive protein SAUR32 [Cryptomeria japonica]GLJ54427.1 hypothetical protein SUGI_1168860 [Cryptomeria japonica]